MFQTTEPRSTVRLGDDPTWWPADWTVGGEAWALVDWRVTAHGDVPGMPGLGNVRVLLRTPLGDFEGEAMVLETVLAYGLVPAQTNLAGNGLLRYVGAAS